MKKLEGEAKKKARKDSASGKGHMIATCPKVRYAKRVLKHLDQSLKEGYKPTGEKKDKEAHRAAGFQGGLCQWPQ